MSEDRPGLSKTSSFSCLFFLTRPGIISHLSILPRGTKWHTFCDKHSVCPIIVKHNIVYCVSRLKHCKELIEVWTRREIHLSQNTETFVVSAVQFHKTNIRRRKQKQRSDKGNNLKRGRINVNCPPQRERERDKERGHWGVLRWFWHFFFFKCLSTKSGDFLI